MGEVALFIVLSIVWWIGCWFFTFIFFGLSIAVIDTIRGYKMENTNKGWIAISILSVPVAIISWLITS